MTDPVPHVHQSGWENLSAGHYHTLLKHLDRTQGFGPAQLLEYQFQRLQPLLIHACQSVPHYQLAFQKAGLNPAAITPEKWSQVPILTREVLQQQEFLSQKIPAQHGRLFKRQSSGSTGQPVTVYKTDYTQFLFDLLSLRDCLWQKWDVRGRFASIRHFTAEDFPADGVVLPSWSRPFDVLFKTGPAMLLSVRTPVSKQLEWLAAHQPDYLQTYPSNLEALIEASQKTKIQLPNLKEVRTTSETLKSELRLMCKEIWGVPVTASYSSEELGYMAIECPDHNLYHVQAESVLLEVLDEAGLPCLPGKVGRVVVTSLLNYATPLLRYEIQDYAEVGNPCPCGRGLPVLNRILGRERNMLIMPSGEKCWPVFSAHYREIAPIQQYQFIQHSLDHIEMRLVAERALSDFELKSLRELIQTSFGYPFNLQFTLVKALPRGENGKYEEFISNVAH